MLIRAQLLFLLALVVFVYVGCKEKVSQSSKNQPPIVSDAVTPDIFVRGSPDKFIVKVKVSDPEGLQDVAKVLYRVYKPDSTVPSFEAEMHDDGENGDEVAGDSIYSFGISSPSQENQTGEYTFEFQAIDRSGNESNRLRVKAIVK